MMNSNRHVLRSTQNRPALQALPTDKSNLINKTKFSNNLAFQQQNLLPSRPILTATRSIKKRRPVPNDENQQPILSIANIQRATIVHLSKQSFVEEENKTREQLEEELFELPDYRQSIFEHLKSVEHLYAPKMNFMENQSDINSAMRTILIDWLIEVADEYKLNDETLFLCVQYVDRFLSTVNVTRSKLQLLGTTSMYIAAKYEEMYPPALDEFSFITDNTYETKHILRMEQIVMKTLNFSLSGPTCYTFLQYYLIHWKPSSNSFDHSDDHQCLTMLSNYLCTLSLLEDRPFSSFRASMIAAACLFQAHRLLNMDFIWTQRHIQLTSYTAVDLHPCASALDLLFAKTYQQDETTSSILRRYLKLIKANENCYSQVKKLIHRELKNKSGCFE